MASSAEPAGRSYPDRKILITLGVVAVPVIVSACWRWMRALVIYRWYNEPDYVRGSW